MSAATVVLVHGAFADSSSWTGVIERLQSRGVPVIAPANPLRGLATDSAYLASVLQEIPGPVVAVGHAYAGAVISSAANQAHNVVALVFVAAFAPEEGENLGEATAASQDAVLSSTLVPRRHAWTPGHEPVVEFSVDPARFHDAFAADLPARQSAVLAATQRPIAEAGFTDPAGPPAWKDLPAWAVVATSDKAAGTDVVRSMAVRAGATIREIDGSHAIMISQPERVAGVILEALAAAAGPGA